MAQIVLEHTSSITTSLSSTIETTAIPAGSDRLLVFLVGMGSSKTIISCKFAGIDLTRHVQHSSGFEKIEIWYLVNPPVGSANLVATFSGDPGTAEGIAYSLSSVDQVVAINQAATNAGSGTSVSTSIAPTVSNSWLFDVGYLTPSLVDPGATVGTDQTASALKGSSGGTFISRKEVNPTSMSWTLNASRTWVHGIVAVSPKQPVASPETGGEPAASVSISGSALVSAGGRTSGTVKQLARAIQSGKIQVLRVAVMVQFQGVRKCVATAVIALPKVGSIYSKDRVAVATGGTRVVAVDSQGVGGSTASTEFLSNAKIGSLFRVDGGIRAFQISQIPEDWDFRILQPFTSE